jgi:hypothetical protein
MSRLPYCLGLSFQRRGRGNSRNRSAQNRSCTRGMINRSVRPDASPRKYLEDFSETPEKPVKRGIRLCGRLLLHPMTDAWDNG